MSKAAELFAEGDAWTDRITRLMTPILLECAKSQQTMTHGGLRDELAKRHRERGAFATTYGYPAGKLGRICIALGDEWGEPVPPLNVILVNQNTGLPGHGADYYLKHFVRQVGGRRLTKSDRDALAQESMEAVFNYPKLDAFAKALSLRGIRPDTPSKVDAIELPQLRVPRGGESEAHKVLKAWVQNNPNRFKRFGVFRKGQSEACLPSGDEIDVLFTNESLRLGVEVKAGEASQSELCRGVFQCVKYRALLRAEAKARAVVPAAQAILVTTATPGKTVKSLAKRLDVELVIVPVPR